MSETTNFLLCGVGGQGTILASEILVNLGLAAGFQAKQAEVHGMSQRGGSVTSHVRWGKIIHSPLIGAGEVDILLAFEKLEALRNLNAIHPDAQVLINSHTINPLTVISGSLPYPSDEIIANTFARVTRHIKIIHGEELAASLGNPRVENVILLGALSHLLAHSALFGNQIPQQTWLDVIQSHVPPKHVNINLKAFQTGREAAAVV